MKKNYFIKKQKTQLIAFLILFCGLFANTAMGQDTFTWNGSTSNDWATPANWTKVGVAGTDTYPGETLGRVLDLVVISNGGTPIVASNVNAYGMVRLTISNATGPVSGSTLTINSGASLNVSSASITNVTLSGGNIVNNGTLNVTSSSTAASAGIACSIPSQLPVSATEYGYSGNGNLGINISASTTANSAVVNVTSLNANTIYKFLFVDTSTTFTLGAAATSYALRNAGGALASSLIIGGTGFTMGTVGIPVKGGLINVGQQSSVTVNSGTTLTLNSASGNLTSGVLVGNSSTVATTFINKGKIYINGTSARGGLQFNTFLAAATLSPFNITNEGIFSVNLNCTNVGFAPLMAGNGGSTNTTTSPVNLTNSGTLTLKNTSTTAGTGYAIFGLVASQAPPVTITNNGTLNLEGSSYSYGNKFSITNNSILKSNSELRSFTAITNNVGGSINFVSTVATATTRQVTFTVLTTALAGLGTNYTDINGNTYSVVSQKFASGTSLVTNVLSTVVNTPVSGNLTRVGDGTATVGNGTGDLTIAFTAFSASALNGALASTTTNAGTINTDTTSNLNIISGVTTTSTSIIAPGGSAGKGIVDFAKAAATLTGKTILQISGSATAGVDYDQITNSTVAGTLSVAGTLDITGIYTPAGPVTIDIVTTEATGSLTGTFGTVIGITTGWTVDYSTAGKVQLVYTLTPTVTNPIWIGVTSSGWNTVTNWDTGVVPDQNSNVTIRLGTLDPPSFQPSPFVNVNIKSLTIDSGATLQLNTGFNFTVKEAITNNGSLTLANNANLIQVNNVANTGNITVYRNSNALSRFDYTIWSSPVVSQDLLLFSPATLPTRFYNYNEVTNLYNVVPSPSGTPFSTGSGYLIRMPDTAVAFPATQTFTAAFTGVPNNGTVTVPMTFNGALFGYNMIGNPYPSTIDAQSFITANTANIESSLYFWRKINAASGSSYAVYNPLGATTATPSSALPNGTIQVGQGFFVKAKSASNVSFTNAMRVANNVNQFFRTQQVEAKNRLWLNLINATGAFSQVLIGYTVDASQGIDIFDAKYINDSPVALTSNINNEEYTIQGRSAFDPSDVVALNFKTDAAGDYTIALDHFDGLFATGQDVYLKDNNTGAETDLKAGSYTFTAAAGVDNARFSLKYQKTLKIDAPLFNENSVRVYKNNGTLYVNSGDVAINNIKVFDIQGKLIVEQKNIKTTAATINNLKATHQVLIVKIAGEDNNVVTKKVVN